MYSLILNQTEIGADTGILERGGECRGFDRTAVDKPPIFQLSQSEALQFVTAYQSLKLRNVLSPLEA